MSEIDVTEDGQTIPPEAFVRPEDQDRQRHALAWDDDYTPAVIDVDQAGELSDDGTELIRLTQEQTEPPAETQQDNEREWGQVLWLRIREAFWARGLAALDSDVAHVAEVVEQYVTERLAVRPSADTETLRQVQHLTDELERSGLPVFAARFRTALDGTR